MAAARAAHSHAGSATIFKLLKMFRFPCSAACYASAYVADALLVPGCVICHAAAATVAVAAQAMVVCMARGRAGRSQGPKEAMLVMPIHARPNLHVCMSKQYNCIITVFADRVFRSHKPALTLVAPSLRLKPTTPDCRNIAVRVSNWGMGLVMPILPCQR